MYFLLELSNRQTIHVPYHSHYAMDSSFDIPRVPRIAFVIGESYAMTKKYPFEKP
jgi:hypothetical protein